MTNKEQFQQRALHGCSAQDIIGYLSSQDDIKKECESWGITQQEWREAHADALLEKVEEIEDSLKRIREAL
jgi:hypothetical protein